MKISTCGTIFSNPLGRKYCDSPTKISTSSCFLGPKYLKLSRYIICSLLLYIRFGIEIWQGYDNIPLPSYVKQERTCVFDAKNQQLLQIIFLKFALDKFPNSLKLSSEKLVLVCMKGDTAENVWTDIDIITEIYVITLLF